MGWGGVGVILFFVLSGFLITYLLMVEKDNIKNIKVKEFYLRRIIRIWPLYFLLILFVYFLIPYIIPQYYLSEIDRFSFKSIMFNILFLTNFTLIFKLTPLIISTIWSIGIEEQFYIIWPWIMKTKKNNYVKLVFLFILIIPFGKILFLILSKLLKNNYIDIISKLISTTRIDCMAIGAFFGILAYHKQIVLGKFTLDYNLFTSNKIQISVYFFLLFIFTLSFFTSFFNQIFNFLIYPTVFGICILNLATNSNSIIKLENKITNYIGVISYSIYLNHMIILYLFFPFLKPMISGKSIIIQNIVVYISTLGIVYLVSYLTYNFYEKQFLKLKKKYSYVST
jgi:peptidoglycan/LPS O-acetylase OafA/YrhL